MSEMTDGQIAEWLLDAEKFRPARPNLPTIRMAQLALALQERLQAAEAEIERLGMAPTADGGFRFEWRDRALRAEAERDEARKERDDAVHVMGESSVLEVARARREAFEEAEKAVGALRGASIEITTGILLNDPVDGPWILYSDAVSAIRALAEVAR